MSRNTGLILVIGLVLVIVGFQGRLAVLLAALFAPDRLTGASSGGGGGSGGGSFG